jgi:hypothetical protein
MARLAICTGDWPSTIGKVEGALAHPLGCAHRLLGVDIGGGLLDQRDDVAHAEDAAGDARRIEILERIELLAGADQLDRLAGDRAHRQRGAAAAVAVDAGEHDAGKPDAFVERACEIDRVLAGEGVCNEQHLVRIGRLFDLRRLVHHLIVERGAAGCVEQHDVIAAEFGGLDSATGNLRRCLALHHRQRVDLCVTAEHRELLHRRRPAHVERSHQHLAALTVGETPGDFCGGRGFARALQADHHDGDWRCGVKVDALATALGTDLTVAAQSGDQLVVHDLHDHLSGRDGFHHLDADGLFLHAFGEGARHVERDIGFQQRPANLAQRGIDIGFAERATAGEAIENTAQFFRQTVEQR